MGRPRIVELTDRDRAALAAVREYAARHGVVPGVRELGRLLRYRTPANAQVEVRRLIGHGLLAEDAGGPRPYKLPDGPRGFSLPFLGVVAAGPPLPAEAAGERFSFSEYFDRPDHFVVQVRGTSMVGALIGDRDYVVLRSISTAQPGETVVCRVGDGHTLKRFRRRGRKVWLEPLNPEAAPIEPAAADDPQVVGVLVGVIRVGGAA